MLKFKQYILGLGFVRAEILKANMEGIDFGVFQSKNENSKTLEQQADQLAEQKVAQLLSFADLNKIVTYNKDAGIIFIGSRRLEPAEIVALKGEADFLLQSNLWSIIGETLKDIACKTMFEKSTTFDDMRSGKMMLYNLSIQNNILNIFKNYAPKKKGKDGKFA